MRLSIIIAFLVLLSSFSIYSSADQENFDLAVDVHTYQSTNWSDTGTFTVSNTTGTTVYFDLGISITNSSANSSSNNTGSNTGGGWLPSGSGNIVSTDFILALFFVLLFAVVVMIKFGVVKW